MEQEMNEPGVSMEAAAPVEVAQEQENRMVPVEALQAERAQRQQVQEELKAIRDHLSLMQMQQKQTGATNQDPYSEDDVLTYGEFKKVLAQREQTLQSSLKELRMTQRYPDYEETVTKYLPEVLKNQPGLRQTLEQTQDYELAYYLAKTSDAYKADNKSKKRSDDAERMVANSQKAGSLSSVGQTSPVSQVRRYKEMSDDDFRKLANKNLGYY